MNGENEKIDRNSDNVDGLGSQKAEKICKQTLRIVSLIEMMIK